MQILSLYLQLELVSKEFRGQEETRIIRYKIFMHRTLYEHEPWVLPEGIISVEFSYVM